MLAEKLEYKNQYNIIDCKDEIWTFSEKKEEMKISYDPNADIRTRYRSDVYSEQCVQSKHREITNYYINITVAFIAYSISDLVFLEGQSLYTNSHPLLCSVFFSSLELGRH